MNWHEKIWNPVLWWGESDNSRKMVFKIPKRKEKKSSDAHLHFELILVDLEQEVWQCPLKKSTGTQHQNQM